jgi:Cu-Zn family superoxide dismutase
MKWLSIIGFMLFSSAAFSSIITVKMYSTAKVGQGASLGSITFTDTKMGLLIEPHLFSLSPGLHGFHIHDHASCAEMGMAAMGHLDPKKTGKHLGPYNINGHLGDLPALYVNKEEKADLVTIAPRLSVKDIMGHAIMIHGGGDNYSDSPEKLGGGGPRIACGLAKID